MSRLNVPLFPLHTVLFPGGVLPLRIFEPRYLDMVSECLRLDSPFGVCLIREGREVGEAANTYDIGTLARISWFERRDDGLLGINVEGGQRFRILTTEVQPNQLIRAGVELLAPEPASAVPADCTPLVALLQGILDQLDFPYAKLERRYEDAAWLGARLTELLPLKLELKQYLLQMDDSQARLERLLAIMESGDFV
ncbi:MAG: LON peptidase substrate-binding domain-containing protein [Pseudomonadota bacterium]